MLYLLFKPGDLQSVPYLFAHEDKVVHFTLFFVLMIGVVIGWTNVSLIAIGAFMVIFAGGTEVIQGYLPTRSADLWDFVADTIGGSCGVLVSFFLKRNQRFAH